MKRTIVIIIGAVLLIIGTLTALEVLPLSLLGLDANTIASRCLGFLIALGACIVFLLAPEKKKTT